MSQRPATTTSSSVLIGLPKLQVPQNRVWGDLCGPSTQRCRSGPWCWEDRLPLLSWLPSQVEGIQEFGPGCQAASPMPVWRLLSWPCPRQLSVPSAPSLESLSAGDGCGDHIVTLPPFRELHGPGGPSPVLFGGVEVHCEVGCTSSMGSGVGGPTACPSSGS